MAVPLAVVAVGKRVLGWGLSNAIWIALALAIGWGGYYIYTKGAESCYEGIVDETAGVVAKEQDKGVAAVKRASKDVTRIKDLEQENARLLSLFDEIPDRATCGYTADELRIVQDIVNQTKRN